MLIAAAQQVSPGNLVEYVAFPLLVIAAVAGARFAWRFQRQVELFIRDFRGEPGRPGVPARPGVMEQLLNMNRRQEAMEGQLAEVHHEMRPNNGWSIKDQVNRIDPLYPTAPPASDDGRSVTG